MALASGAVALGLGLWFLPRGDDPALRLVDDREEFGAFLSERAQEGSVDFDPRRVTAGSMSEEDARKVFSGINSEESVYDPEVFYRHGPNLSNRRRLEEHPGGGWPLITNSQGFRRDTELAQTKPDVRVLVIGDSHTDGACANRHSFASVLERLLTESDPSRTVEVINAGVGSYSFFNYLGAIEKYERELDLDAYVCAVFGGNDFLGTLRPVHYYRRTKLPMGDETYYKRLDRFRRVARFPDRNMGQAVFQLSYLTEFPDQAELAIQTANQLTTEMKRRAEELDLPLIFAYIPPAWDIQLERYEPRAADFPRALRLDPGGVTGADGWADRWTQHVRDLDLPLLDPREAWRAADVNLYWLGDHHINIEGHRRLAEGLLPLVEQALENE